MCLQATNNGAKGIVTVCEAGGTLKPSTNFPLGKASRSLQAAYICMTEGITDKVSDMQGFLDQQAQESAQDTRRETNT